VIPLLVALPGALYALFGLYALIRTIRSVRPLPAPGARVAWPRVSIVVPACNEADTLRDATRTKLASDYPNLEVVVVDDRSTDGTSEIADALAAEDRRVRVVHVRELPDGWLGKIHALARGVEVATGELLLFSDADVRMAPDLLRRAIAVAEDERLGFLALFPQILSSGPLIDVAMSGMLRQLVVAGRPWKVPDPRSTVSVGSGVFNLARRADFERTPGFAWLKLETVDDVAFGQMMKASGARCAVRSAGDRLSLHFYRSLGEFLRGIEKNGYSVLGMLRLHLAALVAALVLLVEVGPFVGVVWPGAPPVARVVGGAALLVTSIVQGGIAAWAKRDVLPAVVPLFGPLVCLFGMVRAVVLAHARGGVTWRGTKYSLPALREGLRVHP
jgi:hypothetical protein